MLLAVLENLFCVATNCGLVVGMMEKWRWQNRVDETVGCGALGDKIEKSG